MTRGPDRNGDVFVLTEKNREELGELQALSAACVKKYPEIVAKDLPECGNLVFRICRTYADISALVRQMPNWEHRESFDERWYRLATLRERDSRVAWYFVERLNLEILRGEVDLPMGVYEGVAKWKDDVEKQIEREKPPKRTEEPTEKHAFVGTIVGLDIVVDDPKTPKEFAHVFGDKYDDRFDYVVVGTTGLFMFAVDATILCGAQRVVDGWWKISDAPARPLQDEKPICYVTTTKAVAEWCRGDANRIQHSGQMLHSISLRKAVEDFLRSKEAAETEEKLRLQRPYKLQTIYPAPRCRNSATDASRCVNRPEMKRVGDSATGPIYRCEDCGDSAIVELTFVETDTRD